MVNTYYSLSRENNLIQHRVSFGKETTDLLSLNSDISIFCYFPKLFVCAYAKLLQSFLTLWK